MKAYLETVVIARKEGGDVSTSCSQIVLEFNRYEYFANFKDNDFNSYEKGTTFEIFRTLIPMS